MFLRHDNKMRIEMIAAAHIRKFGRKLVDLVRGFLEVNNKFEAVDVTLNIANLTTGCGAWDERR